MCHAFDTLPISCSTRARLVASGNSTRALALALAMVAFVSTLTAQPSGGPYGPVARSYEVPADAPHVYYVAPDGRAEAVGALPSEPTTLEAAIGRVVTGDAIILRGGTYRTGGLVLNQSVTMQPFRDERPIIKGTRVATKWVALPDGVWRTAWPTLFPSKPRPWWRRDREGMRTPLHRFNNDMVFVDGESLRSAGWEGELDAHSYYIDYESGQVYVRGDPTNRLVEITAWDSALVCTPKRVHDKESDHRGPTLRGLTFTQYAYRALEIEGKRGSVPATEEPTDDPVGVVDPATIGKEIVGTTIEDCTITHCSRVAGYFRGDRLTIRRCLVSDTSTEGIYVIGSADCLLEKNLIARNNVEQLTGYYPAAVKIFNQTRRVVCRDNLVTDNPNSNGVWYDVGNRDGVFVNNVVEHCQTGFMFEISRGAICAGNVFASCQRGIWVLNSAQVRVYHNTFVNAPATFGRDGRSALGDHFDWHPATGPGVDERDGHEFVGNLLTADDRHRGALLRVDQPAALRARLARSPFARADGNVYVRRGDPATLVTWSPVAESAGGSVEVLALEELRKVVPGVEVHGKSLEAEPAQLFRSPGSRQYGLTRDLGAGEPPPAEIQAVLGGPARAGFGPGAYPVAR